MESCFICDLQKELSNQKRCTGYNFILGHEDIISTFCNSIYSRGAKTRVIDENYRTNRA
jgi:hypothetical protein